MHASFREGFEKTATSKTAGIITKMKAPILKGQRATIGQASKATNVNPTAVRG